MDPISKLLALLERAKCKDVLGMRCFILSQKDFFQAVGIMASGNMDVRHDDKLRRQEGLDNFEFIVTSADKEIYYVCAPAEPVLDKLWESHKK